VQGSCHSAAPMGVVCHHSTQRGFVAGVEKSRQSSDVDGARSFSHHHPVLRIACVGDIDHSDTGSCFRDQTERCALLYQRRRHRRVWGNPPFWSEFAGLSNVNLRTQAFKYQHPVNRVLLPTRADQSHPRETLARVVHTRTRLGDQTSSTAPTRTVR